jgi:transcriptional regulator with PAS, ATPase and Fis domain
MKKEDLNIFGLVEFRPDEGTMFFKDRRMIMLGANIIYDWQQYLAKTLGEKKSRQVITRFGYNEGFLSYLCIKKTFGKHQGFVVVPRLSEVMGLSRIELHSANEEKETFNASVYHYNSVEAEQYLLHSGISTRPVCCFTCGFASGYSTAERNMEVYCKELECVACGNSRCVLVAKDANSWGSEIKTLREDYCFDDFDDVKKLWIGLRERSDLLYIKKKRSVVNINSEYRIDKNTSFRTRALKEIKNSNYIVREQQMLEVLDQAMCVARLNTPVLVQGETGTGKEFIINFIHQQSARKGENLVSVNCAALTESLLESELFGHIRGAFTGAVTDKDGLFELATNGTLFLDELGEMPLALQAKLLRAIENGEIRRVGSNTTIQVNPRILTATNRDLQSFVTAGKFRQDLYFRLNSFVIQLPPLRERSASIPPLVQLFLKRVCSDFGKNIAGVSSEAMARLMVYPWPGNIRELKHAIERAVVVARGDTIQLNDLSFEIRSSSAIPEETHIDLKHGERQVIANVLAANRGNRTATAHDLNISISTLWRKMKRYGLL